MSYEILKKHKSFEGETIFCEHQSKSTKTMMKFSAFLPDSQIDSAIIWLSGLTCTEENFITKAGVQAALEHTNTMIICPDTSPRNLDIKGSEDSYDFGTGASFYVNATAENYKENYQMYDYISKDIIELLKDSFGVKKISITGHSMGGHGALVIGLRENELFESISAFSPICNPMECAWGQKALEGYLGSDKVLWKSYDASDLVSNAQTHKNPILIDQGLDDEFYPDQLLSKNFEKVCSDNNQELTLNLREGYDHSYYFIASFIADHIKFHLKYLK